MSSEFDGHDPQRRSVLAQLLAGSALYTTPLIATLATASSTAAQDDGGASASGSADGGGASASGGGDGGGASSSDGGGASSSGGGDGGGASSSDGGGASGSGSQNDPGSDNNGANDSPPGFSRERNKDLRTHAREDWLSDRQQQRADRKQNR